jgi:RNA-directed DNA polymerase
MTEKVQALNKVTGMFLNNCLEDWKSINWKEVQGRVRQLRQRIYRASEEGEMKKVRSLQRLMMRSTANILWSIHQVTVCNQGKHTPGVDGYTAITNQERLELYKRLMTYNPRDVRPVKRVHIPKAHSQKLRPLGIPTILDRCQQTIVKNALEPYWESKFERSSYGFRLGRSTHDAIERIYITAKGKGKRSWVLDADIEGAFDNITHQHIRQSISKFPGIKWIESWLKSGIIEKGQYIATPKGTPQGGAISPLLLNITLHGIEKVLNVRYDKRGQITRNSPYTVVVYADDFVVLAETKEECQEAEERLSKWLAERGLRLSKEKTQIKHIEEGIDFLSVNIRRRKSKGKKCGQTLLITPSKNAKQHFRDTLRTSWKEVVGKPFPNAIRKLNQQIMGWGNYYRHYGSKRSFKVLDHWMLQRQMEYVRRRHPKKTWKWKRARYWGEIPGREDKWVFMDPETGQFLHKLSWIPINHHIMVKGTNSPDNPKQKEYWKKRQANKKCQQAKYRDKIWKRQEGICPICKTELDNGEEVHVHHIQAKKDGGSNRVENLCILHASCHRQVHGKYRKQLKPLRAA